MDKSNSQPKIVNIVGSGQVDSEIDLQAVADDLNFDTVYVRGPGLYYKYEEEGPTTIVARSGKYIITGASSKEELADTRKQTLRLFNKMGIIDAQEDLDFSIKNIVATADLGNDVDLSSLMIILGLEYTEYEPEQFPCLIYRPDTHDCVVLIFATGRVVITGAREFDTAKKTFKELHDTLDDFI